MEFDEIANTNSCLDVHTVKLRIGTSSSSVCSRCAPSCSAQPLPRAPHSPVSKRRGRRPWRGERHGHWKGRSTQREGSRGGGREVGDAALQRRAREGGARSYPAEREGRRRRGSSSACRRGRSGAMATPPAVPPPRPAVPPPHLAGGRRDERGGRRGGAGCRRA